MLFIHNLLRVFIEQQVSSVLDPEFLERFNHIRVSDSTKFDVPKEFKDVLPGFNGRVSSAAGISIQYEFDIKSGRVLCLDINSATTSDSKHAQKTMEYICERDIVIRDLGFYSKKNLLDIKNKKAFFISRLNAKTKVYEEGTKGTWLRSPLAIFIKKWLKWGLPAKRSWFIFGVTKNCLCG
jgi:hypothetical protein